MVLNGDSYFTIVAFSNKDNGKKSIIINNDRWFLCFGLKLNSRFSPFSCKVSQPSVIIQIARSDKAISKLTSFVFQCMGNTWKVSIKFYASLVINWIQRLFAQTHLLYNVTYIFLDKKFEASFSDARSIVWFLPHTSSLTWAHYSPRANMEHNLW